MIHIAICDDETNIGAELESALIDILGKLNVKHKIDMFFSGKQLYQIMESGEYYDLIFLDIVFTKCELNGVEVGRLIRDVHQNCLVSIVYISWEKRYAMQLFDIQPLNFLVKPLEYEKIEEVLRKYMKIAGFWSGAFSYKIGHDMHKVQVKDIIYIESCDRKLIMRLSGGRQEEFYGSLKEAYNEQLKQFDFLYIHNAYVVNYDYVMALKFDKAVLADSKTLLPISKHKRNEVRERYYEIVKRRGG
jgi:DNA-binding LytR/AlgR family response regulator